MFIQMLPKYCSHSDDIIFNLINLDWENMNSTDEAEITEYILSLSTEVQRSLIKDVLVSDDVSLIKCLEILNSSRKKHNINIDEQDSVIVPEFQKWLINNPNIYVCFANYDNMSMYSFDFFKYICEISTVPRLKHLVTSITKYGTVKYINYLFTLKHNIDPVPLFIEACETKNICTMMYLFDKIECTVENYKDVLGLMEKHSVHWKFVNFLNESKLLETVEVIDKPITVSLMYYSTNKTHDVLSVFFEKFKGKIPYDYIIDLLSVAKHSLQMEQFLKFQRENIEGFENELFVWLIRNKSPEFLKIYMEKMNNVSFELKDLFPRTTNHYNKEYLKVNLNLVKHLFLPNIRECNFDDVHSLISYSDPNLIIEIFETHITAIGEKSVIFEKFCKIPSYFPEKSAIAQIIIDHFSLPYTIVKRGTLMLTDSVPLKEKPGWRKRICDKVYETTDDGICPCCLVEKVDGFLQCGHSVCSQCYKRIYEKTCPFCKVDVLCFISKKCFG